MKGRGLLGLSVLSLALACEGNQQPMGPTAPTDASKFISDGGHGGNRDFFFLPPLVPFPCATCGFELGKFNNALAPSLQVKICELNPEPTGLPINTTECNPAKPLVAEFGAGTTKPINVVNLPLRQNGWWTFFGLPADGFYYVLWDPRQSTQTIDPTKYYRIKVLVAGRTASLGVADLDPMTSIREWRFSKTGDVVQMVNGTLLPIPFRVEQGALCETGTTCTSATYTNAAPLTLAYDPDKTGSTAGVIIPAGALPTPQNSPRFCAENPCPTVVTVNITKVNTDAGEVPTICHPDIPYLQQFKGCYEFTTIPLLHRFANGDQFVSDVFVAVCYELEGTGNPREKFAQLYSSSTDEVERSKWLDDKPEGTLIGAGTKDCTPPPPIPGLGSRGSNPLLQLASSGWRKLKGGLGQVFGVKTAYGIDLGLGGLTKGFSHISPVLRVALRPASATDVEFAPGQQSTIVSAKIEAEHYHDLIEGAVPPGVNTVPVKFTVTADGHNGTLNLLNAAGAGTTDPITVNTAPLSAAVVTDGIASVTWTPPAAAGTYYMIAEGPATGGPIRFTATVPAASGGTFSVRGGVIGTTFLYDPIAMGGGVFFSGPPIWNGGNTQNAPIYRPSGTALNRSIWWNFAPPVTGSYVAHAFVSGALPQAPFTIDATASVTPPTITAHTQPASGQLQIDWTSPPDNKSCFVRVNVVPFPGYNIADYAVPCAQQTFLFTGMALVAGSQYQGSVFAMSRDVQSPEGIAKPFNVGSDSFLFTASTTYVPTSAGFSIQSNPMGGVFSIQSTPTGGGPLAPPPPPVR